MHRKGPTITDCAFELIVEPLEKGRKCLLLGGELCPLRLVLILVTVFQPFLGHILQCQTPTELSVGLSGSIGCDREHAHR
jgi:hypothetical protein